MLVHADGMGLDAVVGHGTHVLEVSVADHVVVSILVRNFVQGMFRRSVYLSLFTPEISI